MIRRLYGRVVARLARGGVLTDAEAAAHRATTDTMSMLGFLQAYYRGRPFLWWRRFSRAASWFALRVWWACRPRGGSAEMVATWETMAREQALHEHITSSYQNDRARLN